MRKQSNQLPNKPSELLALALADLAKVERSSKYEVDMDDWHAPTTKGVCNVCMAASVMAKTLNVDRFETFTPGDFETDTQKKLRAIDRLRKGYLAHALDVLGIDHPRFLVSEIDVADYHDDPKQFKKDMRAIIEALKNVGL